MNKTAKQKALKLITKNIKKAREQTGMSQELFASAAEISRTYYSRIEVGEYNFSILKFIEILIALNITDVNQLLPMAEIEDLLAKEG